ncbi:hypothetical protein M569_01445, partial [Genlisea aurea]
YERVEVRNSHGEKLVGFLHHTGSRELVIICHGFRSSKDRIPMVNLASAFATQRISSAFRFDFAGNGESEGIFQYGNYTREAEDLRSVVEHFQGTGKYHIAAVIGHSGNAVLLYGSRYHDVPTIVNIAGRFDLKRGIEGRLGKDYLDEIEKHGFVQVKNRRGKIEYVVTKTSLTDRLSTDTLSACRSIPPTTRNFFCRVLTVHGTTDEFVPVEDAIEFDKHITNHKLCIFEGADHEFTKFQDELSSLVINFV